LLLWFWGKKFFLAIFHLILWLSVFSLVIYISSIHYE
jgi:hypothetical protein